MQQTGSRFQVIQSVTIATSPVFIFAVGAEHNDREIIEIKDISNQYEDHIEFIYHVLDGDGGLIVSIENCPAIVEYKQIVVDDDVDELPFS